MLPLLESLFNPSGNVVEVTKILIKLLKVNIADSTLQTAIEEHPDFPSLLSISDVLTWYGVENTAINIPPSEILKAPPPFLAQIRVTSKNEDYFTVIKTIDNDTIYYWEPEKHKWMESVMSAFIERCSGIILLARPSENAGEREYRESIRAERKRKLNQMAFVLGIPLLIVLTAIDAMSKEGMRAISPFIYTILSLMGFYISLLLVWYEIDQHNPVLQQICSAGKKIGCAAVLQSKFAKIMGISWSAIGLSFFSGLLFLYIFNGLDHPSLMYQTAWISTLAMLYVPFSVFFQWKIVKKWCILCIFVQLVLTLQFITVSVTNWRRVLPIESLFSGTILSIISGFLISFAIISVLTSIYRVVKEKKYINSELQRIKHNPDVISAMLQQQRSIEQGTNGLGITFGPFDAKYKIIKVCNPYCGPCGKAHSIIEEILKKNSDVQVQVIFTATGEETDFKTKPVRHFLAIAKNGNEQILKKALNDWYMNQIQKYESFAERYPVDADLRLQDTKIKKMHEWCERTKISYTPTFFINGYQLPKAYNISDIKFMFSL